jgi:hypothetical protein
VRIELPRSVFQRNLQGFVQLVQHPERLRSGPLFRTGQTIEKAQLWPTPDFPVTPLLIEYCGTTKTDDSGRPARGHNRGRDIHIIWQFDHRSEERRPWIKIHETEICGPDWERSFRPLIADVIELPEINEEERGWAAANEALAAALEKLANLPTDKTHAIAVSRFYDIVTAAVVDSTHKLADRTHLAAAADALSSLRRPPERVTVSAEPPRPLRKSAEPQKRKRYRRGASVAAEVMELHRADLSLREIAERTGIHYSTAQRLLKAQATADAAPATRSALSRRGLYGNLPKRLRSSIEPAGDQAPGESDAAAADVFAILRKPPGRATKPTARANTAKA